MTAPVWRLSIRMTKPDPAAEAQLWYALVEWCHTRQLFIGGALDAAVIHVPLQPMTAPQRRQLRRWLDARQDLFAYRLELTELGALHSPGFKVAAVEAVSQAQHFLAERMTECADALAELPFVVGRYWTASVLDGGTSLELHSALAQVRVSISKLDRTPVPQLERYAGRRIGLNEIEEMLPYWVGLHWHPLESVSDLSEGEWVAEHRGWRINLYGEPGAGLGHREVMLRLMELVCAS